MINVDDLRNHTEVGTGYTKDAMLNLCADEITSLRSQLEIAVKCLDKIANPAVVGCINDSAVFRKFAQQALAAIRELEK